MTAATVDFKTQHRTMQELARELDLLRKHNMAHKPGDSQAHLFMFAEGGVTLLALEHFLRIVVAGAKDSDSLPGLLIKGVDEGLLEVANVKDVAKTLGKIRGALQHANFRQRAEQLGMDVPTYFRERFTKEVEELYQFANYIMKQVDPKTGKRYTRLKLAPLTLSSAPVPPTGRVRRKKS